MEFLEADDYQQFIVNWQNDQALIVRAKYILKSLNHHLLHYLKFIRFFTKDKSESLCILRWITS
jgi:hypothetical protein